MFDFFSKKKKLKNACELIDKIELSGGKVLMHLKTYDFLDAIKQDLTNKDSYITITHRLGVILMNEISDGLKRKEEAKSLNNLHASLIAAGIFDIWNNELSYFQRETLVLKDMVAYFLDIFIKKYPKFSNLSYNDVHLYLNNDIDMQEIKGFKLHDNYFKQTQRQSEVNDTVRFFEDILTEYHEDFEIEKNTSCHYNFKESFQHNISLIIKNYDALKEEIKKININVFSLDGKDCNNLNIGKYIDFKSLCGYAFFLNIPKFSDKYSISISKKDSESGVEMLYLIIYDIDNETRANENIYNEVVKELKA